MKGLRLVALTIAPLVCDEARQERKRLDISRRDISKDRSRCLSLGCRPGSCGRLWRLWWLWLRSLLPPVQRCIDLQLEPCLVRAQHVGRPLRQQRPLRLGDNQVDAQILQRLDRHHEVLDEARHLRATHLARPRWRARARGHALHCCHAATAAAAQVHPRRNGCTHLPSSGSGGLPQVGVPFCRIGTLGRPSGSSRRAGSRGARGAAGGGGVGGGRRRSGRRRSGPPAAWWRCRRRRSGRWRAGRRRCRCR